MEFDVNYVELVLNLVKISGVVKDSSKGVKGKKILPFLPLPLPYTLVHLFVDPLTCFLCKCVI